jgi:hypothetical protein
MHSKETCSALSIVCNLVIGIYDLHLKYKSPGNFVLPLLPFPFSVFTPPVIAGVPVHRVQKHNNNGYCLHHILDPSFHGNKYKG